MVDAALCEVFCFEGVEGAVFRETYAGGIVRVFQQSRLGENGVNLIVLVHIEISGEDDRKTIGHFLDALHHQFGRLAPGHYAHMIHVEIEVVKGLWSLYIVAVGLFIGLVVLACFHRKLAPSADANTGRIPAQGGLVRRLVEPKVAMIEELELVFFVEDGLVFATMFAIVASYADVIISVQGFLHVKKLAV